MTSSYSYLFRAFYDWLIDNDANPRLVVDATKPGVRVPQGYVTDGVILISIYHLYVNDFNIGPTGISFYTRFKGKEEYVIIPYHAMIELVCSDTGLSIPLNVWLASIELACHQCTVIDEKAIFSELASKEAESASDANPERKKFNEISFSVEDNGEDSSDENAEDSADSKAVEMEHKPQVEALDKASPKEEKEKRKKPDFSFVE